MCNKNKYYLLYDWCNGANKKIFYKDHAIRCRLRRRRGRRSRPPTETITESIL